MLCVDVKCLMIMPHLQHTHILWDAVRSSRIVNEWEYTFLCAQLENCHVSNYDKKLKSEAICCAEEAINFDY